MIAKQQNKKYENIIKKLNLKGEKNVKNKKHKIVQKKLKKIKEKIEAIKESKNEAKIEEKISPINVPKVVKEKIDRTKTITPLSISTSSYYPPIKNLREKKQNIITKEHMHKLEEATPKYVSESKNSGLAVNTINNNLHSNEVEDINLLG